MFQALNMKIKNKRQENGLEKIMDAWALGKKHGQKGWRQ